MTALPAQLELDPQNLKESFMAMWVQNKHEALSKMKIFMNDNLGNFDTLRQAFEILGGVRQQEEFSFHSEDDVLLCDLIIAFVNFKHSDYIWQLALDTLMKIGTDDSFFYASGAIVRLYQSEVDKIPRTEPNPLDQRALRIVATIKDMTQMGSIVSEHLESLGLLSPSIEVTKSAVAALVELGKYYTLKEFARNNPAIIPHFLDCVGNWPLPNQISCLNIVSPVLSFGNEEDKRQLFDWLVKVADSDDRFRNTAIDNRHIVGDNKFDLLKRIQNPYANKVLMDMFEPMLSLGTHLEQALSATIALQTKFAMAASEGRNDTVELENHVRQALGHIVGHMGQISSVPNYIQKLHTVFEKALEQNMMDQSDKGLVEWFNSLAIRQAALDVERKNPVRLAQELRDRLLENTAPL